MKAAIVLLLVVLAEPAVTNAAGGEPQGLGERGSPAAPPQGSGSAPSAVSQSGAEREGGANQKVVLERVVEDGEEAGQPRQAVKGGNESRGPSTRKPGPIRKVLLHPATIVVGLIILKGLWDLGYRRLVVARERSLDVEETMFYGPERRWLADRLRGVF